MPSTRNGRCRHVEKRVIQNCRACGLSEEWTTIPLLKPHGRGVRGYWSHRSRPSWFLSQRSPHADGNRSQVQTSFSKISAKQNIFCRKPGGERIQLSGVKPRKATASQTHKDEVEKSYHLRQNPRNQRLTKWRQEPSSNRQRRAAGQQKQPSTWPNHSKKKASAYHLLDLAGHASERESSWTVAPQSYPEGEKNATRNCRLEKEIIK